MTSYADQLLKCGFSRVIYAPDYDGPRSSIDLNRSDGTTANVSLNYDLRDFDAVGTETPRGERELLAFDLIPAIFMLDMFSRPRHLNDHSTFHCYPNYEGKCQFGNPSLQPLLLIDSRISDTKEHHWPRSLLRLFRNSFKGEMKIMDMKDVYGWKVRSEATCFRSIISTAVKTGDFPPGTFTEDNRFFSVNGLSRKAVGRPKDSTKPCTVKVLVLNRYGRRSFIGGNFLTSAISSLGRELTKGDNTVRIESEEVFFDKCAFHEQVSIMQESDIVVATHGDANANFMFLRPRAKVFEILPFGYTTLLYRNISKAYDVRYETVRSQADSEVFSACVVHFNAENKSYADDFLASWNRLGSDFWNRTVKEKCNTESKYETAEEEVGRGDAVLKKLRACASHQRTSVDVKDLARNIMREIVEMCDAKRNL